MTCIVFNQFLIIQTGCRHHHMVAPMNDGSSSSGAIFRTNSHQAHISGPRDQHLSDSHQTPLGLTPKACFLQTKISIKLFSKFWEIL